MLILVTRMNKSYKAILLDTKIEGNKEVGFGHSKYSPETAVGSLLIKYKIDMKDKFVGIAIDDIRYLFNLEKDKSERDIKEAFNAPDEK